MTEPTDLAAVLRDETESVWVRLNALRRWRGADPAAAAAGLRAAWDDWPAENRRDAVGALAVGLGPHDAALLTDALDAPGTGEEWRDRETRAAAWDLLTRLPDAPRVRVLAAAARTAVRADRAGGAVRVAAAPVPDDLFRPAAGGAPYVPTGGGWGTRATLPPAAERLAGCVSAVLLAEWAAGGVSPRDLAVAAVRGVGRAAGGAGRPPAFDPSPAVLCGWIAAAARPPASFPRLRPLSGGLADALCAADPDAAAVWGRAIADALAEGYHRAGGPDRARWLKRLAAPLFRLGDVIAVLPPDAAAGVAAPLVPLSPALEAAFDDPCRTSVGVPIECVPGPWPADFAAAVRDAAARRVPARRNDPRTVWDRRVR